MTAIVYGGGFLDSVAPELFRQTRTAIKKLEEDSSRAGSHVETIRNCKDPRVRTAKVNQQYRLVLFDLGDRFVLHGVYDHDDAYRIAQRVYLRVNEASQLLEVRDGNADGGGDGDGTTGEGVVPVEEVNSRAAQIAAQMVAEHEAERQARAQDAEAQDAAGAQAPTIGPADVGQSEVAQAAEPKGPVLHVSAEELHDELGIDARVARWAVAVDDVEQLLDMAQKLPSWQGSALLDLATDDSLDLVRARYTLPTREGRPAPARPIGSDEDTPSATEDVQLSLDLGAEVAGFRLMENDEELASILEQKNFGRWRVFLHPEQREYVDKATNGPFRLNGGAGTGKTVVLVHRAVRLVKQGPARIVLTTFTRNLADALGDQVKELDSSAPRARALGRPGIFVKGVDQIAHEVLAASHQIVPAMTTVLGWSTTSRPGPRQATAKAWKDAVRAAGTGLDSRLQSEKFFESEYAEVILPQHLTTEQAYLRAPRAGRGTKLGRKQRKAVWAVIAQYREDGARAEEIDFAETATVAAEALDLDAAQGRGRPADHVLVDEGQDLNPPQWQLMRALVAEGKDDLFIAEDAHQRIYGNRIVLKRYGINIQGRSRRLRLNYRTTEQNLHFALSVLEGGDYSLSEIEDGQFDGAPEELGEYRSARSGPAPVLIGADSVADEYENVAHLVTEWTRELEEEGLSPADLGLLTRSKYERQQLVRALDERKIAVEVVDRNEPRGNVPRVMTLHRSKGMEFARVILFGVSSDSVPAKLRGYDYDDNDEAATDAELRERSLLYVGASRGRDRLAVTWSKGISRLIGN